MTIAKMRIHTRTVPVPDSWSPKKQYGVPQPVLPCCIEAREDGHSLLHLNDPKINTTLDEKSTSSGIAEPYAR